MALTDSKTGFRLPWNTERPAAREATAEPAEAVSSEPTGDQPTAAIPAQDTTAASDHSAEEGLVTSIVTDATSADAIGLGEPGPVSADQESSQDEAPSPQPPAAPEPPAPQESARRPTRFLADLARAMQAAAEQARTATLDQVHADGNAVIEDIHSRSATAVEELRRNADEDVTAIKEWSKAEITRIREETEHRVSSRREQLTGQLDRHAALIEHEIEQVRDRIAAFETEMGRFFDDLLREEDPAQFAARAANLPEPPPFASPDDDALRAILAEPGVGVPEASVPVEPVQDAPAAEAAPADASPAEPVKAQPVDPEAVMAAIQAAAEAAEATEAVEAAEAASSSVADDTSSEPSDTATVEPVQAAETAETTDGAATAVEPAVERDPRLAVLGLIEDNATVEAAAETAASAADEVPELADDTLAARLADLVPGSTASEPAQSVSTQVVTTGLVSVASIAGFKRHLGRLPGVARVGVSSGPDGEFVFAVEHDRSAQLADLIPTIAGFAARVVGSGDGVVEVHAQDPQD